MMRSSDLWQSGFRTWLSFNRSGERSLISALPVKPGVYVVRFCRDYQRKMGSSDVLYVGSATNSQGLRKRLYQYFHPGPTQRTNKRILAIVADCPDFEIAFVETSSIPEAKMLEATLLERYEADLGELPPENKRH
jgi:excinuclease UvrABC nuclease subunit